MGRPQGSWIRLYSNYKLALSSHFWLTNVNLRGAQHLCGLILRHTVGILLSIILLSHYCIIIEMLASDAKS